MLTRTEPVRGPVPARLRPADVVRVGLAGLRARPLRVSLSASGIAIGVAALVAVVGISTASRADLDRALSSLGTNLLRVAPGQTLTGAPAHLPDESVAMIARIGQVESVTATGAIPGRHIYRTDKVPAAESGGISVLAARLDLPDTLQATVASGTWLNPATARYPAVVLGAAAAERLAVPAAGPDVRVWLGGQWFTVIGVLRPVPLAADLDAAALVGWPVAASALGFDGHPSTVYTRARTAAVAEVQAVLGATANPERPNEVQVSRPSDAWLAQRAVETTLSGTLLGLAAVALLVGGVGVANTMIISVLERRGEIGLRRSLGATRGQVRVQFLTESLLLSTLGGAGGALLGLAVAAGYAAYQGWPAAVPAWALAGGVLATVPIGTVAGLYPARRAARLAPAEALTAA